MRCRRRRRRLPAGDPSSLPLPRDDGGRRAPDQKKLAKYHGTRIMSQSDKSPPRRSAIIRYVYCLRAHIPRYSAEAAPTGDFPCFCGTLRTEGDPSTARTSSAPLRMTETPLFCAVARLPCARGAGLTARSDVKTEGLSVSQSRCVIASADRLRPRPAGSESQSLNLQRRKQI